MFSNPSTYYPGSLLIPTSDRANPVPVPHIHPTSSYICSALTFLRPYNLRISEGWYLILHTPTYYTCSHARCWVDHSSTSIPVIVDPCQTTNQTIYDHHLKEFCAAQHQGPRLRVGLLVMRLLRSGTNCLTCYTISIALSVCLNLNEIWNHFSINNHSLSDHVTGPASPRLRFFFSLFMISF